MKIDGILDTDDLANQAVLVGKLCAELNRLDQVHKKACTEIDRLQVELTALQAPKATKPSKSK